MPCGYIFTPVMPAAAAYAMTSDVTEGWSWVEIRWMGFYRGRFKGREGAYEE